MHSQTMSPSLDKRAIRSVPVGAIAADAHAEGARRAALPLRLPHGMQDALADAFQLAVGAAQVIENARHRVLDVFVLAASFLKTLP